MKWEQQRQNLVVGAIWIGRSRLLQSHAAVHGTIPLLLGSLQVVGGEEDRIPVVSGRHSFDHPGQEAAAAGDMDSDGCADFLVGADWTDFGGYNAGSILAFSGRTGALLLAWHGERDQLDLGRFVAGAGDGNADGHDDVIAGVPNAFVPGMGYVGSARVYSGCEGALLHEFFGTVADGMYAWGGGADLSADGRYVAYTSFSDNLVTGDTNQEDDVFVHDRQTGETTRVSVGTSRVQANARSLEPARSSDGRIVTFRNSGTNLVMGDTNLKDDVFLHDRLTGTTIRVSVDSTGAQGNEESPRPSISANGRPISFDSSATILVTGDRNNAVDCFVRDLGPSTLSLFISGSCPGVMTLTVNNATPNGNIAVVHGSAEAFMKHSPPCQGITLAIASPSLGAIFAANAAGTASFKFSAPQSVCGLSVQAVDVSTCTTTNVIIL